MKKETNSSEEKNDLWEADNYIKMPFYNSKIEEDKEFQLIIKGLEGIKTHHMVLDLGGGTGLYGSHICDLIKGKKAFVMILAKICFLLRKIFQMLKL